eukprot:2755338-Prymnesium_polylepis.1
MYPSGQSIARGQPWFPDVQASASEAQVEREDFYVDPKRADGSRKSSKAVAKAVATATKKVFITFSPRVAQMLRERKIKIDY